MLITRTITGLIFGGLVIIGIVYLPSFFFNLLAVLITSLATWEFAGFFWQKNRNKKLGFLVVFLLIFMATELFSAQITLIVGVLWWLTVPYFLWCYTIGKNNFLTKILKRSSKNVRFGEVVSILGKYFIGIMIFIPFLVGLIEVHEKLGVKFLIYLLSVVCAVDIGAYFAGMFWGKHLLAPQISPKKTVEGLLGGILGALIVTFTAVLLLRFGIINMDGVIFDFNSLRGVSLLLLVIITSLWSVIGDLFESMLKRFVGIKDSGRLLPGHGGIYDRIDSLTAAIPIFVLGILLI